MAKGGGLLKRAKCQAASTSRSALAGAMSSTANVCPGAAGRVAGRTECMATQSGQCSSPDGVSEAFAGPSQCWCVAVSATPCVWAAWAVLAAPRSRTQNNANQRFQPAISTGLIADDASRRVTRLGS